MTDLPPRTPPRTDGRRLPETSFSQTSMWLVFLVVGAVILAAIAFTVNRSDGVADSSDPVAVDPAASGSDPDETVPAETGTGIGNATDTGAETGTGTDTAEPAPTGTTGGTTQPAP